MSKEFLAVNVNEAKVIALAYANYSTGLSKAELSVIHDSVRSWSPASHNDGRPENRHVRGDFLRWLLTDPLAAQYLDPDGLQVMAATVDGDVDLNHSHIQSDLMFLSCVFTGSIQLIWAETRSIKVIKSNLIEAPYASPFRFNLQNAIVNGDLNLDGFECHGPIAMYATHIAGDLSMKGAQLLGAEARLYINNAEIKGEAAFETLNSDGPVEILDTRIGTQLIASGAQFHSTLDLTGTNVNGNLTLDHIHLLRNPSSTSGVELTHVKVDRSVVLNGAILERKPWSLSFANATVAGEVSLNDSICAGSVSMWQATVLQTLDASGAQLAGLDCTESRIGHLKWTRIINPQDTVLRLLHANVKDFQDDYPSWPHNGNLCVLGFTYERISLAVPQGVGKTNRSGEEASPDERIAWLKLQRDDEMNVAQPWMQLSQYVSAQGNPAGSNKVLYTMKRIQARKAGLGTYSRSFVYDFIDEEPLRVLFFIGILWVFGSVIFWRARRMDLKAMSPKHQAAFDHFQEHSALPPNHVPFNLFIYVLENILPVVNFGQNDRWAPNPRIETSQGLFWRRWPPRLSYQWLAGVRWLLIALGWVLAIILAGAIGGRFKS